jgi:ADP-heptose:LPS heptosyltransferase
LNIRHLNIHSNFDFRHSNFHSRWPLLRRNVLIFHSGALGDFVLSWPLALALGRIYAQSRITYVTAGQKGALAERALRIDSSDVEAGWHQLYSTDCIPPANVLRLLEGSHTIFSFVAAKDSIWAGNVNRLAPGAKLFFIDPNPPPGFAQHASQLLFDQLRSDPVVSTAVSQMLKSIHDRGLGISGPANGPIVLHPGAGAEQKCWPKDRFIALVNHLREAGKDVVVLLGDVEQERWSKTERDAFTSAATVIMPRSLVDLFVELSRASSVIGNDSGPIHLAGIMGVPTIALFGPTDPAIWQPLGPEVRVIREDTMEKIVVDRVVSLAK